MAAGFRPPGDGAGFVLTADQHVLRVRRADRADALLESLWSIWLRPAISEACS
jgi:hypothetical protein